MQKSCFIGIDTSNYKTSFSVCTEEGEIVSNLKFPLPVKEGEKGLRQSDAVFHHVRNFPLLMNSAEEVMREYSPLAVGVSHRPRDAENSYMPCFLAGKAVASSIAAMLHLPLYEFSHQSGHIMAAAYSSGHQSELLSGPFGAFHVSGGTTEVLYVVPDGSGFTVRLVGGTADLNAGQLIDRIGVNMGFSFPSGPELEACAMQNTAKIPKSRVQVKDGVCNLSGIENLANDLFRKTADPALVSAYVLELIGETLRKMTDDLLSKYPGIPVLYAGGVMSNRFLQEKLGARQATYFASPAFSSDNAAGIALLCRAGYRSGLPV